MQPAHLLPALLVLFPGEPLHALHGGHQVLARGLKEHVGGVEEAAGSRVGGNGKEPESGTGTEVKVVRLRLYVCVRWVYVVQCKVKAGRAAEEWGNSRGGDSRPCAEQKHGRVSRVGR